MNFQHPAKPLGQLADRIAFASAEKIIMLFSSGASAIGMPCGKCWARAPADALGVKQEFEKALAQDSKPPK